MTLTPAQQSTLKTYIENDVTLNAFPNTSDGAAGIAAELNKLATPDFTVWKTSVPLQDVGNNFDGSELSSLTTAESNRLQVFALYAQAGINPADADVRFLFDDVFSGAGGATTRANLLILWKRLALTIEKVLSTGTGSDADPADLVYEGTISWPDVFAARNSV